VDYIDKLFNLENKVVAITGAGGFLCSNIALGLARANMKVIVLDKKISKAEATSNKINSEGFESMAIGVDVCEKSSFKNCLNEIIEKFGNVDVLINGAGINAPTPFLDINIEEWDNILNVNLKGTLLGCQIFGAYMIDRGEGSIINISSASSDPPLSKAFTYSVSKAGVKNLTQNLAREWAKNGVRVNALRPGFFPTKWSMKNFITADREASILNHTPMGRYGNPDELVGAVLWLSSEASSFVTGAEITVDGGFTAMSI